MTREWNGSKFRTERGSCRKCADLAQYLCGCWCAQYEERPHSLPIEPDGTHSFRQAALEFDVCESDQQYPDHIDASYARRPTGACDAHRGKAEMTVNQSPVSY